MASDLKDIQNAVTGVIEILKSNETESMPALASALPRGIDPIATDPTWSSEPQVMKLRLTYPPATEIPGINEDDVITLGVRWNYNGQVGGRGRFIKDLEAFVITGHISLTVRFDVFVKFAESGTPVGDEPIAMLTGSFNVRVGSSVFGETFSEFYGIRVFGDGAGDIKEITG
jgi:hypothetical protein